VLMGALPAALLALTLDALLGAAAPEHSPLPDGPRR